MRDGLADHWRESYVCETGKSMNAGAASEIPEWLLVQNRLHAYAVGRFLNEREWPIVVRKLDRDSRNRKICGIENV
jgi:hypothetical protein